MDAVGLEKEKPQIRKNVLSSNTYMNIHTVDGSEIRRSPVEVGSLFHMWQGFSTIQVGWSQLLKPLKLRKNSSFLEGSKPNLVLLLPFLIHTYNNIWPTTSMGGTVYFPTSTIKIHIYHKYKYHKHLHLLRHFCHPTKVLSRGEESTAHRCTDLSSPGGIFPWDQSMTGWKALVFWLDPYHPLWMSNVKFKFFHVDIVMFPCWYCHDAMWYCHYVPLQSGQIMTFRKPRFPWKQPGPDFPYY